MIRHGRKIIFGIFLFTLIAYPFAVSWAMTKAEELLSESGKKELVIERPTVVYESQQLRDPFRTLILPKVDAPVVVAQDEEPLPDLSKFVVQGIIWGGRIPQALINKQVYTVGDTLDGGEIVSINKDEIVLRFSGRVVSLLAPGAGAATASANNNAPVGTAAPVARFPQGNKPEPGTIPMVNLR